MAMQSHLTIAIYFTNNFYSKIASEKLLFYFLFAKFCTKSTRLQQPGQTLQSAGIAVVSDNLRLVGT